MLAIRSSLAGSVIVSAGGAPSPSVPGSGPGGTSTGTAGDRLAGRRPRGCSRLQRSSRLAGSPRRGSGGRAPRRARCRSRSARSTLSFTEWMDERSSTRPRSGPRCPGTSRRASGPEGSTRPSPPRRRRARTPARGRPSRARLRGRRRVDEVAVSRLRTGRSLDRHSHAPGGVRRGGAPRAPRVPRRGRRPARAGGSTRRASDRHDLVRRPRASAARRTPRTVIGGLDSSPVRERARARSAPPSRGRPTRPGTRPRRRVPSQSNERSPSTATSPWSSWSEAIMRASAVIGVRERAAERPRVLGAREDADVHHDVGGRRARSSPSSGRRCGSCRRRRSPRRRRAAGRRGPARARAGARSSTPPRPRPRPSPCTEVPVAEPARGARRRG